jgi:CheY-like chemotaxis protein
VANYLAKPITQSDLLKAMIRVLGSTPIPCSPAALAPASQAASATAVCSSYARRNGQSNSNGHPESLANPNGNGRGNGSGSPLQRLLRILLAEDNPVNQTLAVHLLKHRGHEVTVAEDGLQALTAYDTEPFDLVLMDVQMPNLGGFEATALIRQREQSAGRHIPIIAMTARAMKGNREECLAAGFDDYLAKPLRARELHDLIERTVSLFPPAAPAMPPAIDKEIIHDLVGGDTLLLRDLIALFLEGIPAMRERMRAAIENRDAFRLNEAAHELKGAASHFAAMATVEAARRLEAMGRDNDLTHAESAFQIVEAELDRLQSALSELVTPAQPVEAGR